MPDVPFDEQLADMASRYQEIVKKRLALRKRFDEAAGDVIRPVFSRTVQNQAIMGLRSAGVQFSEGADLRQPEIEIGACRLPGNYDVRDEVSLHAGTSFLRYRLDLVRECAIREICISGQMEEELLLPIDKIGSEPVKEATLQFIRLSLGIDTKARGGS